MSCLSQSQYSLLSKLPFSCLTSFIHGDKKDKYHPPQESQGEKNKSPILLGTFTILSVGPLEESTSITPYSLFHLSNLSLRTINYLRNSSSIFFPSSSNHSNQATIISYLDYCKSLLTRKPVSNSAPYQPVPDWYGYL